ncbi:cupredoxin domain-containing protein [Mesorhizobium sp.]|uniref:cupredoxin domain-containing protein n=1 Tax=Mesorhizobium sp. TaxID=1871066 RepID=UPI0025D54572|nr:cupredoxin domain-containing protein [Mesorhizobium sp.]
MTPDRWMVTIAGIGLVAFIIWFFWFRRSTGVRAAETSGGYQEAMILVKGGYTPDTIIVRSGRPVRLNFRREETASCSDKVIFADFQKSAELPTGETVAVELMPKEAGEFVFACPMGMFRGRLIVE